MGDALKDFVYETARYSSVSDIRIRCPSCSPNRRLIHRNEVTLSITVTGDKAAFFCHHCSVKGAVSLRENNPEPVSFQKIRTAVAPKAIAKPVETSELTLAAIEFLKGRGISAPTAGAAGVVSARAWLRELGRDAEVIAFPYLNGKVPYAFKYRSIESKDFSCNGAPATFFNVEAHTGDTLVIVEGEMDVLAFCEAGIPFVVSVPNGASSVTHDRRVANELEGGKLGFLWAHRELLDRVKKIVIATDADKPGQALAEEIARRVGKGKCFLVSFPDGCKDANDVLTQCGPEGVQALLSGAQPVPVAGLHSAIEFQSHLEDLYKNGLKGGASTGWTSVDKVATISQGMLYVVTGIPGSGKSSWIDALTINLARTMGWNTVMASFENPIPIHIAKLCSIYAGKAFGEKHSHRMDLAEVQQAYRWVNNHFMFMSNDVEMPTVQSILDRARIGILRMGAKVVVMDPANFLQYKDGEQDHNEKVDDALVQFKNFAMANEVAFFLVAHPRKPSSMSGHDWSPAGYDISGTAGYYNRSDIGMTIHRTEDDFTRVITWKARFNHIANLGEALLSHDVSTGRFTESFVRPQKEEGEPWYI